MKAQDLRIGNFIHYDGWTLLSAITAKDLAHLEKHPDDPKYQSVLLTEEILLKAGFEKYEFEGIGENHVTWNNEDSQWLYVDEGKFYHDFVSSDDSEVRYLHELQNLYYALKHEELEVRL